MSLTPSTRRVNQRHDVKIDATVSVDGIVREIVILNISVGGLYFIDDYKFKSRQLVSVEFSIPNLAEPLKVDTMVRWLEHLDDSPDGIGVQFIGMKAKEVWALTRYFSIIQAQEV
jgi:PilZ domain